MKITSRTNKTYKEVYDIGLKEEHNFVLENGLVASNCFNKAHSISYSFLTYISAYLKANYPVEFFCSLMSVRSKTLQPKTWAMKAPEYIQEAKTLGVIINPPSVNGSSIDFTIQENEVYFGLNAIRDVGKTAAKSIVTTRGNKSFQDVYDFLARVNLQKVTIKTFQSLIRAGAFDKLGYTRSELLDKSNDLYKYVRDVVDYEQRKIDSAARIVENEKLTLLINKRNELRKQLKVQARLLKKADTSTEIQKQERLISVIEEELQPLEDLKLRKKPQLKEKEEPVKIELERFTEVPLNLKDIMEQAHYIGCYVQTHPALLINHDCETFVNVWQGQQALICGVVNSLKVITTKKGTKMAFAEIDDSTSTADLTIFSRQWAKVVEHIQVGSLIRANVKVESESPNVKLIAQNIEIYKET